MDGNPTRLIAASSASRGGGRKTVQSADLDHGIGESPI
jgi:hypothetical protein